MKIDDYDVPVTKQNLELASWVDGEAAHRVMTDHGTPADFGEGSAWSHEFLTACGVEHSQDNTEDVLITFSTAIKVAHALLEPYRVFGAAMKQVDERQDFSSADSEPGKRSGSESAETTD